MAPEVDVFEIDLFAVTPPLALLRGETRVDPELAEPNGERYRLVWTAIETFSNWLHESLLFWSIPFLPAAAMEILKSPVS
jgi:hypothetical protein